MVPTLQNFVPIIPSSFWQMNPERKVRASRPDDRLFREISKCTPCVIGVHGRDDLRPRTHS